MYKYKYTIEDCHKIAAKKKGQFLSPVYLKANDYYLWKCENPKHDEFKKSFSQVLANKWCPKCKYEKISQKLRGKHTKSGITYDITVCKKIAEENGGECLSTVYINRKEKLRWRCKEGHEWDASFGSIYYQNTWCPKCVNKNKDLSDCIALAKKNSGEYLGSKYEGYQKNVKWKCNNGHIFDRTYEAVSSGRWCPKCSDSMGEKIARGSLERIFNCQFKKKRPKKLRNSGGNILELDGFNETLNLAFEYQGEQHFRYIPYFHRSTDAFEKRINDDREKADWCNENGIKLIVIPYFSDFSDLDEIFSTIENLLKQLKIEIPEYTRPATIGEIIQSEYSELDLICRRHNGRLVTDAFLGWGQKHEFECEKLHRWTTTAGSIRRGSWCKKCTFNELGKKKRKYTTEDAKELAKTKGGLCLSENSSITTDTDLKWKCGNCDKEWLAPISRILTGSWCPECGRKKSDVNRRAYTIEDLKQFASTKNGKCLSTEYTRADEHYTWECQKKHQWEASFNDIKGSKKHKATWCPECSKKKKHTLEEMKQYAETKGGKCLSTKYINAKAPLLWVCSCGREFNESWTNIQGGRWCRRNCKHGKFGVGRTPLRNPRKFTDIKSSVIEEQ